MSQFLELASKDIVQLQLLRNLSRNVELMSSPCIEIHLLKENQICVGTGQEVYDACQLKPAIDIPVDHLDWAPRLEQPACGRKVADFDLLVGAHILG